MQKYNKIPKLTTWVIAALFYVIARLFDWWLENSLDALAEGKALSDWMTKAADLLGYVTHPYVLAFLCGGFVFSFSEWWPYILKIVSYIKHQLSTPSTPNTDINISVGTRQLYGPNLLDKPAKTFIYKIYQDSLLFTRVSMCPNYFRDKLILMSNCVVTNHSDLPVFKIKLPITIEYYEKGNLTYYLHDIDESMALVSSLNATIQLHEPLPAHSSVDFWLCNETENYIKMKFNEKLTAQIEQGHDVTEIPYTFELAPNYIVQIPNIKNMNKWLEEKNDCLKKKI